MKHLKSIKMYDGMMALWPTTDIIEPVNVSTVLKKYENRKVFSIGENGNAVMYLDRGEAYIAPWTGELVAELKLLGYKKENFFVPFDDGNSVPLYDRPEWEHLLLISKASYRDYTLNSNLAYSKRHDIGRVPYRILRKCLEIPEQGMVVRYNVNKETIFPMLDSLRPNAERSIYLGSYCVSEYLDDVNGSIIIFVIDEGKTFVGKVSSEQGLIKRLKRAGFHETKMRIPFADGALPVDAKLRARWLGLPVIK